MFQELSVNALEVLDMEEQEIVAIEFFINIANNYLVKHQDEKKSKEKTIFYLDLLKNKLVLERMLVEKGAGEWKQESKLV